MLRGGTSFEIDMSKFFLLNAFFAGAGETASRLSCCRVVRSRTASMESGLRSQKTERLQNGFSDNNSAGLSG